MIAPIFWIGLALVAWTYAGYALFVTWRARRRGKGVRVISRQPADSSSERLAAENVSDPFLFFPPVTVVIAAYNEAQRIAARVQNVLAQDYPADCLQVLVVSDGSRDGTERMLAGSGERVRVLSLPDNHGKALALNAALAQVTTEFVIFSDARQQFAPDAVRRLMAAFADPRVGAVSGELEIVERFAGSRQMVDAGLYWRMEKRLREREALLGWLHGVSGAVYALRRSLFVPLPPGLLLDDMWIPLQAIFAGRRIWMARDAVAYDAPSATTGEEYRRKLRTLAGNWQLIGCLPRLLLPWRNPVWFAWLSHKFLRLLAPWALVAVWLASAFADGMFYRAAFIVQGVAYALALFALLAPRIAARIPLLPAAGSFVMLNAAALQSLPALLAFDARRLWKKH